MGDAMNHILTALNPYLNPYKEQEILTYILSRENLQRMPPGISQHLLHENNSLIREKQIAVHGGSLATGDFCLVSTVLLKVQK